MKLIEKKEQKKVPELIWGAKYKMLKDNEWHAKGETVLLCSTKLDYDAEVPVYSESGEGWAEPEDLQLISEDAEGTEEPETTYVIEFTESELQSIVTGFGATSLSDRRSSARVNGYPESVAVLWHGIYDFLKKEVLQGEDK